MRSTHRQTPPTILAAFGRLATHVGYPSVAMAVGVDRSVIGRYISGEYAIPLDVLVEVVQTYQRQPHSPETAELARQIAVAHAELYGGLFVVPERGEPSERRRVERRATDMVTTAAEYATISARTDVSGRQHANLLRPPLERLGRLVERERACLAVHGGTHGGVGGRVGSGRVKGFDRI